MSKFTVYTIDEIINQAHRLGMPLDKMRFFPGEDRHEARCFGIYRDDSGDYIVYKNKSDGSRAVRYKGKDEAKACQIFWDKLEDEIRIRMKERDWWKHQQAMASDPEYAKEFEAEITRRKKERTAASRQEGKKSILPAAAMAAGAVGLVLAGNMLFLYCVFSFSFLLPSVFLWYTPSSNTS